MAKRTLSVLFMILFVSSVGTAQDATVDMTEVTSRLLCPCGCSNMLLSSCICETSQALHSEIQQEIDTGKSAEVIMAGLVDQYGPQMWAAPPARGFNLMAWIMPGVITLVLLALFIWVIRAKLTQQPGKVTSTDSPPADEYVQRIEEDLRRIR